MENAAPWIKSGILLDRCSWEKGLRNLSSFSRSDQQPHARYTNAKRNSLARLRHKIRECDQTLT
jgi:hypothetical protein